MSNTVTMPSRSRPLRASAVVATVAVVVASGVQFLGATGAVAEVAQQDSRFREVGQLVLPVEAPLAASDVSRSGWLILNTRMRRAYEVFEYFGGTVVQSFDLDTLQPRRRVQFEGLPITSGTADATNPSATQGAGELVHAVDEEAGRLYMALGLGQSTSFSSPDGQRQLTRIVAIDEAKFDSCAGQAGCAFAGAFMPPSSQARLQAHFLLGLKSTRFGRPAGSTASIAKLLAVFAAPTNSALVIGPIQPSPHDHELVQWDPSTVTFSAGVERDLTRTQPLLDAGTWAHHLTGCGTASMASSGSGPGVGNYQWGILVNAQAIHVGCQSASGAATVVRVPVGQDALGNPTVQPAGGETTFPLSLPLSDVLADDGGQRLLIRSWVQGGSGTGHTWWVFDARKSRYAGSVAALQGIGIPMGAGVDSTTGRLYSLTPDHPTFDAKGNTVPVRGGFQFSDTRLDPVPPLENARPDLAYNGGAAIRVDPVTRRVFMRRGSPLASVMATYPSTQSTTPAPIENFYRVFEDRVPIPEQPPEIDDSGFTTDVDEAEGLTTASYLGSGSGFGSRVVLTGGTRALTQGQSLNSPCSTDDRELVVGSVGSASLSDQSTQAEAAAMDADSRTREAFGDPLNKCRPTPSGKFEGCTLKAGSTQLDTNELAFDKPQETADGKPVDGNNDGCPDRDGKNQYAADCVTDKTETSDTVVRSVPRSGFTAETRCRQKEEKAEAEATGRFSAADLLTPLATTPAAPITVGHSHSDVTVTRKLGQGIQVHVDSIARDIEIPGVGSIGVVRSEATSKATGQGNGAKGTFTRTICGVSLDTLQQADCIRDPKQQQAVVDALNLALGSRGRARLRSPDDVLETGSPSGYRAAIQREHDDLFADRVIDRDESLAVTGLELVFFQGDGGNIGAARQIFQFAGVQAATSYGIACLYGNLGGRCAKDGESLGGTTEIVTVTEDGEEIVTTIIEQDGSATSTAPPPKRESRIVRLLKAPFRAAAEAFRLLFNHPRELGLMAAVWALLYLPCYLGERRRSILGLRAARAAGP